MRVPLKKSFQLFLFYLLAISVSSEVNALPLLSIVLKIASKNFYPLIDYCHQSGAEYHLIQDPEAEITDSCASTILISHSPGTTSLLCTRALAYGVTYNNKKHLNFGVFFPKLAEISPGFFRYTIYRSFWLHLYHTAKHNARDIEAATAKSLFQTESDVEVVLVFGLHNLTDKSINQCVEHIHGVCQTTGWKCVLPPEKGDNLQLIIPLGGEVDSQNSSNIQEFTLNKEAVLQATKSGIRRKGSEKNDFMLYFPSRAHKVFASEAPEPTDIDDNIDDKNDYTALFMSSANNLTNVWVFPRQTSQWQSAEPDGTNDLLSAAEKDYPSSLLPPTPATDLQLPQTSQMELNDFRTPEESSYTLEESFYIPEERSYKSRKSASRKLQSYLQKMGYSKHKMPKDYYCGWHAVAQWMITQRPDLADTINGDMTDSPARLTFSYFSNQVQQMIMDGDERHSIHSLASDMNSSRTRRMWLNYRHLRHLISPFIQQNIFIFDTTSINPASRLSFRVDVLMPGENSIGLVSEEEVTRAIQDSPGSMMLLHTLNHWSLIMPSSIPAVSAAPLQPEIDSTDMMEWEPYQSSDPLLAQELNLGLEELFRESGKGSDPSYFSQ